MDKQQQNHHREGTATEATGGRGHLNIFLGPILRQRKPISVNKLCL